MALVDKFAVTNFAALIEEQAAVDAANAPSWMDRWLDGDLTTAKDVSDIGAAITVGLAGTEIAALSGVAAIGPAFDVLAWIPFITNPISDGIYYVGTNLGEGLASAYLSLTEEEVYDE